MKKKLFLCFVLVMLFCPTCVIGQLPPATLNTLYQDATLNQYNLRVGKTKYKTFDGALTYYEYTDNTDPLHPIPMSAFVFNSGITVCYTFDLPKNIEVYDFAEVDNTGFVVFCGRKNVSVNQPDYNAIIGWFWLNPSQVSVSYLEFEDVYEFLTLEGYTDGQGYGVAAIGKRYTTMWGDVLLHIKKLPSTYFPSYTYELYDVPLHQGLWDIIKTQEYMVFVGYDGNQNGLSIRREKYVTLQTPTELHNSYYYPVMDSEPLTQTVSAFLGNRESRLSHEIVIGAPASPNGTSIESRYRVIDISTMDMINSQKFDLAGKIALNGMAYAHSTGRLGVLLGGNPLNEAWETPIVFLDPHLQNNYTAPMMVPEKSYGSIDDLPQNYPNTYHLLLGGGTVMGPRWYIKHAGYHYGTPGCAEYDQIRVETIPNLEKNMYYDPLMPFNSNIVLSLDNLMPCPQLQLVPPTCTNDF